MGFHKRFITEDNLKKAYKNGGYELLVDTIVKTDSIYIGDEFSEKVIDLIYDGKPKEEIEKYFNTNEN